MAIGEDDPREDINQQYLEDKEMHSLEEIVEMNKPSNLKHHNLALEVVVVTDNGQKVIATCDASWIAEDESFELWTRASVDGKLQGRVKLTTENGILTS